MAVTARRNLDRWRLVRALDDALDKPMIALALVWLVLLVLDLVYGLSQTGEMVSTGIWVAFVVEFAVKLLLAPDKLKFLLRNWLTALSLLLPALRVLRPLRIVRLTRGARGVQVVRVVGSLNRGMRAVSRAMGRRGFGYVVILSVLVAFGGAAGMYALEKNAPGGGFTNYGDALWWTAMALTTSGTNHTPSTNEGRVLAFLLALYAFSVFGIVTATLASFFVERDANSEEAETVGRAEIQQLVQEVRALRIEIETRHQGGTRPHF